jgi:hypothetical protein
MNAQIDHCACGCRQPVKNGKKYRLGHWAKTEEGSLFLSSRCKKKPYNHGDGYTAMTVSPGKQKLTHVVIAEQAIGKTLPHGAEVHHVDGDRSNNAKNNLVICSDKKYHALLHVRTRAYEISGDANLRQCGFCRKWDKPENLYIPPNGKGRVEHRSCGRAYRAEMIERKANQNEHAK